MMKYSILLLFLVALIGCKNVTKQSASEISEVKETVKVSKEINREVEDTIDGGTMLLGAINRKGLTETPYNEWFTTSQKEHPLDSVTIEKLQPLLTDVHLTIFMGTWCEDSQREVPALYKILDAANYNYSHLSVIAVSHDKDTPTGLEKGHNIEFVPTIIFTKAGDTLNRIVEYAHATLEQDMLSILNGEDYTPAYAD